MSETAPYRDAAVDPVRFREVLGHYPTGVAVVTGIADDGEAVAMVVGTFTSVSIDPLLVAFLPARTSYTFARLRTASSFTVNIFAHDQEDLCRRLAKPSPDKLAAESWTLSPAGAPVLDGVVAWIDCSFHSVLEAGDHYIVLGDVLGLHTGSAAAPLVFFQGGYGGFVAQTFVTSTDLQLAAAVSTAQVLSKDLVELATELNAEITVFARLNDDAVAVASAPAPDGTTQTPLGARYPLIPPLGVPFIAWSDPADQQAWINRARGASEQDRAKYRGWLEAARARGWSLSVDAPGRRAQLEAAVQEYGQTVPLPARGRVLSEQIVRSGQYFDVGELEPDNVYDVAAIMAPINGAEASPQLMLRLFFPPPHASGQRVCEWGDRLAAFGRTAAAKLSG